MYYWWRASRCFRMLDRSQQRNWNKAIEAAALKGQAGDGSWPPIGAWGMHGGQAYSTAVMVIALQSVFG